MATSTLPERPGESIPPDSPLNEDQLRKLGDFSEGDPLENMGHVNAEGYEEPLPEERQENRNYDPLRLQELEAKKEAKLEADTQKAQSGTSKLQKISGGPAASEGKELAKQKVADTERRAARQVAKEASAAVKKAAQAAGKAIASVAKKAVASLAASPVTWIVVGIAALIIIILIIIVVLFGFSGKGGKGFPQKPTTPTQLEAVNEIQALSGDKLSNTKYLVATINTAKGRLTKIKSITGQAFPSDPAKATAASTELDAIMADMDKIVAEPTLEKRKILVTAVSNRLVAFNKTYPELIGYGAVHGSYLPVPGVIEGYGGQCGHASILMTILYYNPGFTDSTYYDPATHTTKSNSSCVTPAYINNGTGKSDWDYATSKQASLDNVKKSLAGGDPVIMYAKAGLIFSTSEHIFVIVGYDPADDSFIINNPNVGNVEVHTKKPNNQTITTSRMKQYFGDSDGTYTHTFLIRSAYLK